MSFQNEANQCAALLFGFHISLYWMSVWTLMLAWCEIPVNVLLGHVVCDLNAAGKGRGETIPAFSLFSGVFGSYIWVLYFNFVVLPCTNYCNLLPEYNDWATFFESLRLPCTFRMTVAQFTQIFSLLQCLAYDKWRESLVTKRCLWWIFLHPSVQAGSLVL